MRPSPDYTVRESARATRVCLKVSLAGQLEVVVPRGFDPRRVPELVDRKRAWIDKALRRVDEQRPLFAPNISKAPPDEITLQAIGETWNVEYHALADASRVTLQQQDTRLLVRGAVDDAALCRAVLKMWLSRQAQAHLVSWLDEVSAQTGLSYRQARVRGQKTRWGSCSRSKTINLNYKLLFLAAPLVRCVLVHELCHTVHFNHSSSFWALMAEKEPGYEALDAELRAARRHVPGWAD